MNQHDDRRAFLGKAGKAAAALSLTNLDLPAARGADQNQPQTKTGAVGFAIHGGAGTMARGQMTAELEAEYRAGLTAALVAGHDILRAGGASLDAVIAAITILEDNPLFNAGKGAVFTDAGTNELDASIMEGRTLRAGAVAGVRRIKNPITLARLVMERSPHVLFTTDAAERFAQEQNIALVDPKYFYTEQRWQDLQRAKERQRQQQRPPTPGTPRELGSLQPAGAIYDDKFGTVGAVALDRAGDLAAGTSTGGFTNKRSGRVGDSPIIGAGTYADNSTCAVSATGDGEYFIRAAVAHDISAQIAYRNSDIETAAAAAIAKVGRLGGSGGVIAIDRNGRIAMPFNTPGMYRGYIDSAGKPVVKIYKD